MFHRAMHRVLYADSDVKFRECCICENSMATEIFIENFTESLSVYEMSEIRQI